MILLFLARCSNYFNLSYKDICIAFVGHPGNQFIKYVNICSYCGIYPRFDNNIDNNNNRWKQF